MNVKGRIMRNDSNLFNNIVYPEKFNSDFVYTYIGFDAELKEMIERSGYKSEFARKYRFILIQLVDLKTNCIVLCKRFEKLRNIENLYAMRLSGEKNIRILFTFRICSNKTIAILLYPFEEKDSKNDSNTSYNKAVKIANERIGTLQKYSR